MIEVVPEKNSAPIAAPAREAVASGDIPGVACLVWRRGEPLQFAAAGLRDVENNLPVRRDTIFRIASMSKPVTSAAALILIEKGVMRLDDPISKWAPEFSNMRVLRRPDADLQDTYPAPRAITIEDLLTHRSGLSYAFTAKGPLAQALEARYGLKVDGWHTSDEWMAALASLPLSFAPGARFNYSHSTDVLGFIVGRAAGATFRETLRELLFEPLGMADTDFWVPHEKRERAAVLYGTAQAGIFTPHPLPGFLDETPPVITAGGQGLVSTVDDYLAFARMLLEGGAIEGKKILSPESIRLMTTNRLTAAQRRDFQFGIPFFMAQGFGLGVSIVEDPKKNAWMGLGSRGSFGWPGLFGGWWQADPQRQTVMIWLQQTMPPQAPAGNDSMMGSSRAGESLTRWLFAHPNVLAFMSKMGRRSGKAPRMPGVAGVQAFQRAAIAAMT